MKTVTQNILYRQALISYANNTECQFINDVLQNLRSSSRFTKPLMKSAKDFRKEI